MKKILMLSVMLLAVLTTKAQNEEGECSWMVKAGVNLATVTGSSDSKMIPGFAGGFELEYGLTDQVGLSAAVIASMQGEKEKDIDLELLFNYVNVPLLVQFYPVKGLAIKAGAQLGFMMGKKAKIDGQKIDIDNLEALTGMSSEFRKFDLAIPMGLSYEWKKFVLDVRYNMGLIPINKEGDKLRNSVVQMTLGYKFPF
jgi:hypothetical protein